LAGNKNLFRTSTGLSTKAAPQDYLSVSVTLSIENKNCQMIHLAISNSFAAFLGNAF
jgi:ABC-type uncharacterized transport system permease subunit